jgi:hypothetical protein
VKVENSVILMSSKSSNLKSYSKQESLKTWVGKERPDLEGKGLSAEQLANVQLDTVELSDQAKALLSQGKKNPTEVAPVDTSVIYEISEQDKLKISLLERMLEALTGKKIRFFVLKAIKSAQGKTDFYINRKNLASQIRQRSGWGLEYDYHESYYEQEKMSFAVQGLVKTADGKEISLSVQLNMSREFASQKNISIRAGDAVAVDPLVINFNGKAPALTEKKFSFDLDSDGKEDQISFVGSDSGFLAVDLNDDGLVNDGKELFGPNTGNGFHELAKYDEDGNHWIDENDSIYDQLQLWTKDSEGKDVLFALGQKGIGAIYLGNIDTVFSIKNQENSLQGEVKKSGIYINENGTGGVVQQIDLTI